MTCGWSLHLGWAGGLPGAQCVARGSEFSLEKTGRKLEAHSLWPELPNLHPVAVLVCAQGGDLEEAHTESPLLPGHLGACGLAVCLQTCCCTEAAPTT